jgi:pre-rRNA-processing protein TSR2
MSNNNNNNITLTPPPGWYDEFRAGVTACLRSWSALKTAVDMGWGGYDSMTKADALRRHILESFDGTPRGVPHCTKEDIEDDLAIYMEEEFSVTLEDESERQVADVLFRMYEECARGDYSRVRHVVDTCHKAQSQLSTMPVQLQSMDDDDDDDLVESHMDNDMNDNDDAMDAVDTTEPPVHTPPVEALPPHPLLGMTAAEYASQPLFDNTPKASSKKNTRPPPPVRQLGEPVPEPVAPPVDEDGFVAVVKRKGRST